MFASGVGEGFAALAAFAIASRVLGFFKQSITAASEFTSAFAGVKRTVDTTAEGFSNLRTRILELSTTLPFTASTIANVASEAGRLGVEAQNIEAFSTTILKLSTITGQAPDELAGNLARFATVTQRSLGTVGQLSDVLLKLDVASAASSTEILHFTTRLAPLAVTAKISAESILAIATGLRQAGVEAQAGGTAVTQTINKMIAAAAGSGPIGEFSQLLGITTNQFRELVRSDPTEALLKFLDALSQAGTGAQANLESLGLGSVRVSTSILALAGSHDKLRGFIDLTGKAQGELNRQFSIFSATPEQRLKILTNTFEKTRIEISNKLTPAIIGILTPFSQLSTATVSLGAAFAGLAAGGFAFVRLRNIIGSFSTTISGAQLTTGGFNAILKEANVTGATFASVLDRVKTGELTYVEATNAAAGATGKLVATQEAAILSAQRQAAAKPITLRTAFAGARLDQAAQNAARNVAALAGTEQFAATVTKVYGASFAQAVVSTEAFSAAQTVAVGRIEGFVAATRVAIASVGLMSAALSALNVAFIALLAVDIFTNLIRGAQTFFDELERGKPNIDAVENSLFRAFKNAAGPAGEFQLKVEDIDASLKKARIGAEGFGGKLAGGIGQALTDILNPFGALADVGKSLTETGIPVVKQLGQAFNVVGDGVSRLINQVPFLGRIVRTNSEQAVSALGDLDKGLTNILETLGPEAAQALLDVFKPKLLEQGFTTGDIESGLEIIINKIANTKESADLLKDSAPALIARLQAIGVPAEEIASILAGLGLQAEAAAAGFGDLGAAAEGAKGALSAIGEAQTAFTERVKSLIPKFGTLILDVKKSGKAASDATRAALQNARAIADAERALANARRDAARQTADAKRRLAETEIDAARGVQDAEERLAESRFNSTRQVRDAQEELQDFNRGLEAVGGAQTEEDLIRRRELEQAVADSIIDARHEEVQAEQEVVDARVQGAEDIAEAQRRLVEVELDAAQKIADALEKLARAHEDAAHRSEGSARKIASASDGIVKSAKELLATFTANNTALNTFADLIDTAAGRIFDVFKDRDVGEAFLHNLQEMGPAAIPLIKSIVKLSDKELRKIVGAFGGTIKAAKRLADQEFDRFPPNFEIKMKPIVETVLKNMLEASAAFDLLPNASEAAAEDTIARLAPLGLEIKAFAEAGVINLKPAEKALLAVGLAAGGDTFERIAALKELTESINSRDFEFNVTGTTDSAAQKLFDLFGVDAIDRHVDIRLRISGDALGGTVTRALGGSIKRAAFGSTSRIGEPIIVGDDLTGGGGELFIPNQDGAIFSHRDTGRILNALKVGRTGVTQHITVVEVAQDPRATARAVSFALGSAATR